MTKMVPIDFEGRTIELRGFLRTEEVSGFSGLWLRVEDESVIIEFDNMVERQLKGTVDWKEYSVKLPLSSSARKLFFGVLQLGSGKTWADDLQLLADGKSIGETPRIERPKSAIELDHEFDRGSAITLATLSDVQIQNLATLGKVWGFLKYHHPQITSGRRHWDYDLFRVLPAILAAPDNSTANSALLKWIPGVGETNQRPVVATLVEKDLHLRPETSWISNQALLGAELSQTLVAIHKRRPFDGKQFYVSKVNGVGNPSFDHEPNYRSLKFPDAGFQILGAYRFWNIIQYWFPYRDVLEENWDKVLIESLPKIALAADSETYQRELMALVARAHDTHANLWSSLQVRPPVGTNQLPVIVRYVENRPVIIGFYSPDVEEKSGFKRGDVIAAIDGMDVEQLVQEWAPYYAASNEPTRRRDLAQSLTRGKAGRVLIRVQRGNESLEIAAERVPNSTLKFSAATHDLPGETFRLLSPEIAYLKLSSVRSAEAASYIERAAGTKGLIIDIRNYPSEFVVFSLGSLLIEKKIPFATFTEGDLSNPGAFHWRSTLSLEPQKPHYAGSIVILVNEVSQSQAEYTTMAFRSAPKAKVVGSTTAGADGNVSTIPLPGDFRSMISGIGVFYPDKRPTQRIGIIPDVVVKPTIAGVRAGRDEVLEEAVRQILGPKTPADIVEKLAKP